MSTDLERLLMERVQQLETERSLTQRVDELGAQLRQAADAAAADTAELQARAARISELEAELARTQTCLDDALELMRRQSDELARLGSDHQQRAAVVDDLRGTGHTYQVQINRLAGELESAHLQTAAARQHADELQAELAVRDRRIADLEQQADKQSPAYSGSVRDAVVWLHLNGMHAPADALTRQFTQAAHT